MRTLPLLLSLSLVSAPALAGEGPAPTRDDAAKSTLSTASQSLLPTITFWTSDSGDGFIKPVLQIGSTVVGYFPDSDQNEDLAARVSTLALARFGLEGQLFGFIRFRSVFERNVGFSLSRNGPVGTSVWEGTASLQARENYLQVNWEGLSVTGGIFPDPASLDYISSNILDTFGMDPYVRDPLLVGGFGQGQGVMVRYRAMLGDAGALSGGLSFTGGNPLTTSLAFGFGGNVSSLGTLFTAPLRAMSNGVPGSDIQLTTLTPSLTWESDLFDIKIAAQLYWVDVDVTKEDDKDLTGWNIRGTLQVKLLDNALRIFVSGAGRQNQQLAIPDITTRRDDNYEGTVFGGGFDVAHGDFGAGAQYYYIHSKLSELSELTNHYINVGLTWWIQPPFVSAGLRWARSMAEAEPNDPLLKATDSVILSLRLLL